MRIQGLGAGLRAPTPGAEFHHLFIHTTTSSIVPEAISVEVMMTLTENTMKGDGKEEGG